LSDKNKKKLAFIGANNDYRGFLTLIG